MHIHSSRCTSSAFSVWNSYIINSPRFRTCLIPFSNKHSFVAVASSFSSIHSTSSIKPVSYDDTYRQSHLESVHEDESNRENYDDFTTSSSAVASAIQKSSSSPVEFVQLVETPSTASNLVLPSPDFCLLSSQQLGLFRRIVHPSAVLSVYVRPAGGYVMDRLELRRVSCHPGETSLTDIVILIGNFTIPTGLRAAEAVFSSQPVHFLPELRSIVFPLVKRPFVVGFLVAEFPAIETNESILPISNQTHDIITLPSPENTQMPWNSRPYDDEILRTYDFSTEQMLRAVDISNSLALAYVMDQKAMLLQKSSWQSNIRMNTLVDQIRGPLSSIRSLSKLLTTHVKKNEIASDIVEDILVQGDRIRDTLEELQEAVYVTKTNIIRFNEESLKRLNTNQVSKNVPSITTSTSAKDMEMPMPPLTLAPLQRVVRPCIVGEVVSVLVDAATPLAQKQRREVVFADHVPGMAVCVEEPALRQALSNLIEGALLRTRVGGRVEITCAGVAAVGALVVVEDDGPDMHFMTQTHALAPYGEALSAEDSMTWNFVAGLAVAREILESYGCVVKVVSPRFGDAAVGSSGNVIEIWLPSLPQA